MILALATERARQDRPQRPEQVVYTILEERVACGIQKELLQCKTPLEPEQQGKTCPAVVCAARA